MKTSKNYLSVILLFYITTGLIAQDLPLNPIKLEYTLSYLWDETNQDWALESKETYNYSSSGYAIMRYGKEIDSDLWIDLSKKNIDINITEIGVEQKLVTEYYFDIETSLFKEDKKHEIHTDKNNKVLLYASYIWNAEFNNWEGTIKHEFQYNDNGDKLSASYFIGWDLLKNDWVGTNKFEYNFDSNGKQILNVNYEWDAINSVWVNTQKVETYYNEFNKKDYDIIQNWDSGSNE